MQRYSIVLAAILAFVATSAHADPEPWMKKEDPSELAVLAMADEECPLSSEELQEIADAVLVEKDIRPVRGYESPWSDNSAKVVMLVRLQCLPEQAPVHH